MAAGTEINLYAVGDVDLTALMNTVDLQRVTYQGLSLTNYDNTSLPAIAAGSLAEVAGALFKFASEEAITGWGAISNDTAAYIKLVPAGTDPDTVTAEFTDTAPTWSDAKQGWYGTGGAANHRYVATLHRVDAATYSNKNLYEGRYGEKVIDEKIIFSLTGSLKSMAGAEDWVVPRGIYTYVVKSSSTTSLDVYVSGAWQRSNTSVRGGMVMSDGVNVRFHQTTATTGSIYYLKLD